MSSFKLSRTFTFDNKAYRLVADDHDCKCLTIRLEDDATSGYYQLSGNCKSERSAASMSNTMMRPVEIVNNFQSAIDIIERFAKSLKDTKMSEIDYKSSQFLDAYNSVISVFVGKANCEDSDLLVTLTLGKAHIVSDCKYINKISISFKADSLYAAGRRLSEFLKVLQNEFDLVVSEIPIPEVQSHLRNKGKIIKSMSSAPSVGKAEKKGILGYLKSIFA